MPIDLRIALSSELGVQEEDGHSRYLGMPIMIGRRKVKVFRFFIDKLKSQIQD